ESLKAHKQGRAELPESDKKRASSKGHKQGGVESTARDEKGTSSKARKQGGAATKSESADRSATGASTKRT
ncbi:unnamed protein product, partial [Rotaria magnacalcarata]